MQHPAKAILWLTLIASICTWSTVGQTAERYTTQRGDTLWKIAGRYAQDDTISKYQMVQALFDANPRAFINNDINRLKIGYELRIPAREELRPAPVPPASGDERDTASVAEPLIEKMASEEAEAPSAIDAQDVAQLRSDLALTQEQAAQHQVENEVLRDRVAALEARVTSLSETTPAQAATRDNPEITQPSVSSHTTTWFTLPNIAMLLGVIVLGLIVAWLWRVTEASDTPPPHADDLNAEQAAASVSAPSLIREQALETDASADIEFAELIIDLDDLELGPVQAGEDKAAVPNTASIPPKAEAPSPSNVC